MSSYVIRPTAALPPATLDRSLGTQGRPKRTMSRLVVTWVLLLPIMFFSVGGYFSFEDTSSTDANAGAMAGLASSGHHLGIVGWVVIPGIAYGVTMWLIFRHSHRVLQMAMQMKLLSVLALMTICSALWSQVPLRSLYNGVFYAVGTMFAFYLVSRFETEDLIELVKVAGLVISVASIASIILAPRYGLTHNARDNGAWQGIFGNRTSAGKCLVFLLSPAILFRSSSLRVKNLAYMALLLLFIFMTRAQTARALLLVYIPVMASISLLARLEKRSAFFVSALCLLIAASSIGLFISVLPTLLGALGRDATLSGRTLIWAALMRSIAKRPLLGYGFYAFWLGLVGESGRAIMAVRWAFGYAHNGFIEICLQLGLVGLAIFLGTLLQAMRNAWFCVRNNCSTAVHWYVGMIVLTIFYNIDEATVVWPNDLLSILYVVACCGLARAASELKSKRLREGSSVYDVTNLSPAR